MVVLDRGTKVGHLTIQSYTLDNAYMCLCDCGRTLYVKFEDIEKYRNRKYCTNALVVYNNLLTTGMNDYSFRELTHYCKFAVQDYSNEIVRLVNKYGFEYADKDIDYRGKIFSSYEVIKNTDKFKYIGFKQGNNISFKAYKILECCCYLCNSVEYYTANDLKVLSPIYGISDGINTYHSKAYCTCYKHSGQQWLVCKILEQRHINYRVEYSFNELYGVNGGLLSYDFAVFDSNNTLKYLIECQGKQHYSPVKNFGGAEKFTVQKEHDKRKREYAEKHNIKLVEISYKYRKYGDVLYVLRRNGVIK